MMRFLMVFIIFALLLPPPIYAGRISLIDGTINSWVSDQDPWVDDTIHFSTGVAIFSLSYWVLGKAEYFQEHKWQRRLLAGSIPLSLRVIEESTNDHPDWGSDITWNVIGIAFAMSFTFDEATNFFNHLIIWDW